MPEAYRRGGRTDDSMPRLPRSGAGRPVSAAAVLVDLRETRRRRWNGGADWS